MSARAKPQERSGGCGSAKRCCCAGEDGRSRIARRDFLWLCCRTRQKRGGTQGGPQQANLAMQSGGRRLHQSGC